MNKIYLIDFGISQRYKASNGEHVKLEKQPLFKGNLIFSSKNAFKQVTLSRRDDIISLAYFMTFCVNSNITWLDNQIPISNQFN